jgi:hypothetical protein
LVATAPAQEPMNQEISDSGQGFQAQQIGKVDIDNRRVSGPLILLVLAALVVVALTIYLLRPKSAAPGGPSEVTPRKVGGTLRPSNPGIEIIRDERTVYAHRALTAPDERIRWTRTITAVRRGSAPQLQIGASSDVHFFAGDHLDHVDEFVEKGLDGNTAKMSYIAYLDVSGEAIGIPFRRTLDLQYRNELREENPPNVDLRVPEQVSEAISLHLILPLGVSLDTVGGKRSRFDENGVAVDEDLHLTRADFKSYPLKLEGANVLVIEWTIKSPIHPATYELYWSWPKSP